MSTTRVPHERVQDAREARKRSRRALLGGAAASALVATAAKLPFARSVEAQELSAQAERTYANDKSFQILSGQPAEHYPSVIRVRGMPGTILLNGGVEVRLHGLRHDRIRDVQIALESPVGTIVWVMGTVGGPETGSPGSGFNLRIYDGAPTSFPQTDFNSGSYKPTNTVPGKSEIFPTPARRPVTSTSFNDFSGERPNGEWRLYIFDDEHLADGSLQSWSLHLTTTNSAPIVRNDRYTVRPGQILKVKRPGLLRNDRDRDDDRLQVNPFRQNSDLGRLTVKKNGSIRFEANEDARGTARFDYTVVDGHGGQATGKIIIKVRGGRRRNRDR